MLKGWDEIQATWMIAVVPIIRNYYAELLMHPQFANRDIVQAEEQLALALEESKASAFHRSAIQALSLRACLALIQGQTETALDYSTQAIEYLDRFGGVLPVLRTEEVLWNHYQVLQAAGRGADAESYLERAHAVVQRKVSSIADSKQRWNFLERVPLNRRIIAAVSPVSLPTAR